MNYDSYKDVCLKPENGPENKFTQHYGESYK